MGGRVPGKININMVFDKETLKAICDGNDVPATGTPVHTCNWFNENQICGDGPGGDLFFNLLNLLVLQRTPSGGVPGPNDSPFWSLATGPATGLDAAGSSGDPLNPSAFTNPGTGMQRGILNTLLRDITAPALTTPPTSPGLMMDPFADSNTSPPSPGHPYQRYQLLTKIFNNLTTRSNVFAIWLTVGFFEVARDPTTGLYVTDTPLSATNPPPPVKLGAEIGSAESRQIRHRAFAIVDRTNLQVFSATSTAAVTASTAPYTPQTVSLGTITPTYMYPFTGSPSVQPGMVLVYEPNTDNEETVVVQSGSTATFLRSHASGVPVICRGNPGPQALYGNPATINSSGNPFVGICGGTVTPIRRYDPRQDTAVVPYFALID